VTLADLRHLGISKRVNKAKLAEVLQERYPLHKWEKVLSKGRYSQQRVLENIVISLFSVRLLPPLTGQRHLLILYALTGPGGEAECQKRGRID